PGRPGSVASSRDAPEHRDGSWFVRGPRVAGARRMKHLLLLATLAACAESPELGTTSQSIHYIVAGPTWRYPAIPVCFDDASSASAGARRLIRTAAEDT